MKRVMYARFIEEPLANGPTDAQLEANNWFVLTEHRDGILVRTLSHECPSRRTEVI